MMDVRIRIREAVPSDIPALLSMEERIFASPWRLDDFNALFQYPHYETLVAEKENELLGYIISSCILPEENIDNLAVTEEARKQGIGGTLVENTLLRAKERGVTRMTLEVREHNVPARKLYEKYGFTSFSRRTDYYQDPAEDAILYEKML